MGPHLRNIEESVLEVGTMEEAQLSSTSCGSNLGQLLFQAADLFPRVLRCIGEGDSSAANQIA